ncbi:ATP-binding protein [Bacillus anthracis]|nr:ATP-binding protein [Bacillus anthracis]
MKKYYEQKQILILINQLCMIIFLCYEFSTNNIIGTAKLLPLLLITIMAIYGSYISFINLKNNTLLSQFSSLLLFTSWQFLLTLNDNQIFRTFSTLLSVFILYKIVQFILLFFFQDSIYSYKKEKDWILRITCLLTLGAYLINDRVFSVLFSFQWFISVSWIIFLFLQHHKRITFVLKTEKKHLLTSTTILIFPFIVYVTLFGRSPEYVNNLGWYIIILFPLFSIHAIAFKNHISMKQYFPLKKGAIAFMFVCIFIFMSALGVLFQFNMITYFIFIHTIIWFVQLYFTLLFQTTKNTISNLNTKELKTLPESSYIHNLVQIVKEEQLKSGFSNYLHDEILQDILAVKNMMNKSSKKEIHDIIITTLDNLSHTIRIEMQEYHPTLLKTLTLKENYRNLLKMIQKKYETKHVNIFFTCNDDLFLVEPYHLVVYRILKELVTNAFKHSNCSKLHVHLAQENEEIKLIVNDNGKGLTITETDILNGHKGLNSIKEQLFLLNGKITISNSNPFGLCITIIIPMKGDDSYKHFINR